ncbi:serine/threonine-protein kinase [Streptomyces sp. 7R007]
MGEVFAGRYELVDPIGRGGVGAVWRAWDHRRRRYVAAKVLQQSDAHSLLRFVREQALRIDHPHVLAPASWAADDDKVLFTMDLVAGGSLVHLVGDYGPLPPAFVCTLLDQLLSGLAAVHAEGVVHRDIKPANILLEATGAGRPRLRLSDFGIAMRLGEPRLTETDLVVGTPGYLAPEQMLGADPDFAADLFATGLVALYLLEGAKPDAKALVQYFATHGTPSAPKGIPEPLWQVVATLLQPDPQARFRTATGARKALAAAVELLPEPGPDDEQIEIFDQLGPLPPGFGPRGPLKPAPGVAAGRSTRPPSASEADTDTATDTATATGTITVTGTGTGTGSRTVPAEPPSVEEEAEASPSPASADPRRSREPAPQQAADTAASAPSWPAMSDTGSFHLPPPQPSPTPTRTDQSPRPPVSPHASSPAPHVSPHMSPHGSPYVSPHDPTQALTPPPPQRADASTLWYTAQIPQVPHPAQEITHPNLQASPQPPRPGTRQAARQAAREAARRARRPGPPAKVAIPLLLFSLACYAIGFWALARI